jgi:AcrR family transcriptional regulator
MNQPRGRGRPRAGDPEQISEVALKLIRTRGYAATTMADIASAAGISPPTLFRYFPSKADILWFGMGESAHRFRAAFDAIDEDVPVVDAVFAAYLQMLQTSPIRLSLIKSRIAVVHLEDSAADAAWKWFEEWGRMVTEFVARRRGIPAASMEAVVTGTVIWAALWAAVSRWALGDDADPAPAIEAARQILHLACSPT